MHINEGGTGHSIFQRSLATPVPSLRLRSMADPFPDGPTLGSSVAPSSVAPTIAPTMAQIATAMEQQQNSNLLPWLNFCVYVLFTFLILGLMVYINRYVESIVTSLIVKCHSCSFVMHLRQWLSFNHSKKNPSLNATRDRATIVSVRTLAVLNAQQHVDTVRNMTEEERMEYVTSILKTQVRHFEYDKLLRKQFFLVLLCLICRYRRQYAFTVS
jgi:hypothetical protein